MNRGEPDEAHVCAACMGEAIGACDLELVFLVDPPAG